MVTTPPIRGRSPVRGLLADAALARKVLASHLGPLPHPHKLTFALTYRCNSRCKTCMIWRRDAGDELSIDEIGRFFDQARGFSWIDLTGGEPSLRRDLPEICRIITGTNRQLVLLHFPTNGLMPEKTLEAAEAVVSNWRGRLVVTVSMDGDRSLNDQVRGIPGAWDKQIETFRRLDDMGVDVVFGMTISRHNIDAFDRTFAAASAACPGLTLDRFHFNIVQESGHFYGNEGLDLKGDRYPSEIASLLERYRSALGSPRTPRAFLEREYQRRIPRFLDTGVTPMPCHALRSSCFVSPDGTVYPCSTYARPVGRLRETGMALEPIWGSEDARALAREIWQGTCPQCWTPCEAYQTLLGHMLRPSYWLGR